MSQQLNPGVPMDAIQILENATANMTGTRKDHQAIAAALNTLYAIHRPAPPQKTGPQGVAGKKSETSATDTPSGSSNTQNNDAPTESKSSDDFDPKNPPPGGNA